MNRTLFRSVVICLFVIGVSAGFFFPADKAYARVSLSDLQAHIDAPQGQIDLLQGDIDAMGHSLDSG